MKGETTQEVASPLPVFRQGCLREAGHLFRQAVPGTLGSRKPRGRETKSKGMSWNKPEMGFPGMAQAARGSQEREGEERAVVLRSLWMLKSGAQSSSRRVLTGEVATWGFQHPEGGQSRKK